MQNYISSNGGGEGTPRRLVSKAAGNGNLYVTYSELDGSTLAEGYITVKDLQVIRDTDSKEMTEKTDIVIHLLAMKGD